jgi:chemotaxis protein MotB
MNARVPRSRVSHERWLVSYADFITLMFAFFVVLYAYAQADKKKQVQVSASIDSAFRTMAMASKASPINSAKGGESPASLRTQETAQVTMPAHVKDDLEKLRKQLTQTLSSQIASHAVALEMGRDGLVISLREAGFFDSGSATPKPQSLPTLRTIGGKLGETPYDLRVEGHTDNVPIHNAEFESNWELSSLRATSIARLFIEMKAIEPDRVSAAGYAEYHPVASNDTEEGRAQNRRVDLVVMPRISLNFAAARSGHQPGDWKRITDEDQSATLP